MAPRRQRPARVGWRKVAVTLAEKNARMLWTALAKGRRFDPDRVSVPRRLPWPVCGHGRLNEDADDSDLSEDVLA